MVTRPVVWSASSINSYNTCHLAWYLGYVLMEPGQRSEAMEVGIEVHDYAERALRHFGMVPTEELHTDDPLVKIKGIFRIDILPTYRDPVLIEAPFQIEVDGIPFSGVIDSVDRHDPWGEMPPPMPRRNVPYANILRDLKTTGSRPAAGKYRLNMIGYWLGATDLGFPPDAMQLDYIVRTKAPYYWPEVMDPVTDEDVDWFAGTLQSVSDSVGREDYEPTALGSRSCSSCTHRAICGPLARYKEITG